MWVTRNKKEYDVDFTERCLFLFVIFIVYICQSESAGDHNVDRSKKQLEELEETKEDQREKELAKIYSSSKANEFLTYDKCLQRMKCPTSRKEECSEECKAGNTEEELEEHQELTRDEHKSSLNKLPKQKYEANINPKKQPSKNKHSSSHKQSNTKTDL